MKNKGLRQYRFKDNSLEEAFAMAWEKANTDFYGKLNGRGYLDYLLAKDNNRPESKLLELKLVIKREHSKSTTLYDHKWVKSKSESK